MVNLFVQLVDRMYFCWITWVGSETLDASNTSISTCFPVRSCACDCMSWQVAVSISYCEEQKWLWDVSVLVVLKGRRVIWTFSGEHATGTIAWSPEPITLRCWWESYLSSAISDLFQQQRCLSGATFAQLNNYCWANERHSYCICELARTLDFHRQWRN